MSGGTWDYDQNRVHDLADRVRYGRARWHDDGSEPLDLHVARELVADILDLAAQLVKELDWHHAGDEHIGDEAAWVESARTRVHHLVSTDWGVMQRGKPGLHRGPMTRAEAEAWVMETEEDGVKPGVFYVAKRSVTPWERASRG